MQMKNSSNYHIFDYIVIGKGLMGAAAARYLSQISANVAVIGPDEPEDYASHPGVFGSHYDQGRITRRLSGDVVWSALAMRAMEQYRLLERRSGLLFYRPVGCLFVAPPADPYFEDVVKTAVPLHVDYTAYAQADLRTAFPFLHFPAETAALFEPDPAGYIHPREMVRAQLRVAVSQGARVVREAVTAVAPVSSGVIITTESGQVFWTRKALVAAGAFSNCYDLLPERLPLRVKTETVLLARLPESEARRLEKMPSVVYKMRSAALDSIYMLPPIRYPDGQVYVKLGANTAADQWPEDLAQMREWMIRGDGDVLKGDMVAAMTAVLPGLAAEAFVTKRCLVAYTPHGRPFIDQVGEHLFVAAGGNGSAAKSSDTIGWLAANLMQAGNFPAGFRREDFAVGADFGTQIKADGR